MVGWLAMGISVTGGGGKRYVWRLVEGGVVVRRRRGGFIRGG